MEKDGHIIFIRPEFGLDQVKITDNHSFNIVSSKDSCGKSGPMNEHNVYTFFTTERRGSLPHCVH